MLELFFSRTSVSRSEKMVELLLSIRNNYRINKEA